MQVVRFRRLQATRMIAESRVSNDLPESFRADLSLSNMLVTVNPGTESSLGVVKMKGGDLLEPDQGFNFANSRIPPLASTYVISGRKEMRGVEAKSQASRQQD